MQTSSRQTQPPRWIEPLLTQKFFHTCTTHASMKKNECNIYCVDCVSSGICQHCLHDHRGHRTLQIRRYVYHDVVRIQDLEPIIVMDGVQSYHINNASVAFLNQRPKLRPMHNPGQMCETCSRGLQDNNRFCSLACKVESLMKTPGSQFVPPHADEVSLDSGGPQTPDLQSYNNTFKRKFASSSDDDDEEVNNYRTRESRRKTFVPRRSPVC